MSADAPGWVHLLPSSELFRRGYGASAYAAMCGLVLRGPGGAEADHPRYCPKCVNAALRSSAPGMPADASGGGG
ncbi:MAG TPA: hypothetical protein VFO16_02620 [Pseudonocardiaceae bacterium]|nr:hypothetical protein [Pseudonocardiaceae bacterium]